MGTIYLVRHGQGSFKGDNYDRLSPVGIRQSRLFGEHFAAAGCRLTGLCHGELQRQRHTAREVVGVLQAAGRPVPAPRTISGFNEYDAFALWDACTPLLIRRGEITAAELAAARENSPVFKKILRLVMLLWMDGRHDREIRLPSWRDFQHQVTSAFTQLLREAESDDQIAVFTSGGPIGIIVQHLLGLSQEKTLELTFLLMNASLTRIKHRRGQTTLAAFNETAHLERHGDRELLTYV